MMFELFTFCTSIVAQDANNHILHGRNLDWYLPTDMKKISFVGEFYKGGQLVFKGNLLVGMVGVITGEKPDVFAISANNRADWSNVEDHPARHPIKDLEGFMKNVYNMF